MQSSIISRHRRLFYAFLAAWAGTSAAALLFGWGDLFPALGSLALAVGISVFLTDRARITEARRLWDAEVETQIRMIWRYMRRLRHAEASEDPLSLDDLESRISDSFEALLAAKHAETRLETTRYEMTFSILGTLQWGFGGMLIGWLHG